MSWTFLKSSRLRFTPSGISCCGGCTTISVGVDGVCVSEVSRSFSSLVGYPLSSCDGTDRYVLPCALRLCYRRCGALPAPSSRYGVRWRGNPLLCRPVSRVSVSSSDCVGSVRVFRFWGYTSLYEQRCGVFGRCRYRSSARYGTAPQFWRDVH